MATRYSQPQGRPAIDWSNPLCRALSHVSVGDSAVNLIDNKVGTKVGTVTKDVGPRGTALRTATGAGNRVDFAHPLDTGGSEYTFGSVFTQVNPAAFQYLIMREIAGVLGGTQTILFGLQNSGGASKLQISFGSAGVFQGNTTVVDSVWHVASVSTPPNGDITALNAKAFIDGVKDPVGTSTNSGTVGPSAQTNLYLNGRPSDNLRQLNGAQALRVEWRRVLTDAEHASFNANPWQIFQPANRQLFVPSAGAPAGAFLGWFDGELRPDGWFDAELQAAGWWDTEIIQTAGGGGGGSTTVTCAVADATANGVSAAINFASSCAVAASSATGVSSQIPTALPMAIGGAAAVGVTARVAKTIAPSVAAASAVGVSALANYALNCAPGAATATGATALLPTAMPVAVADAAAVGVGATISVAGSTVVTCTVGNALATGAAELTNIVLPVAVAGASAVGEVAGIPVTLSALVGAAAGQGVVTALPLTLAPAVGAAAAVGVTASINLAGSVTITCTVGSATAQGVSGLVNVVLKASVAGSVGDGVAAAGALRLSAGVAGADSTGLTAQLQRIFGVGVGNAIASGVNAATQSGELYVPNPTDFYRRVATSVMNGRVSGENSAIFVRIGRRRGR